MNVAKKQTAGRPPLAPSALKLRRMGKHFAKAKQLMDEYNNSGTEIRESGRGKQPFNSYIKSLQSSIGLYKEYLELLAIYADQAGLELNATYSITDEDKEKPWAKLKETYRDKDNNKLPLKAEFKERIKVFTANHKAYNKDYPYLDWSTFWFESEYNAIQRVAHQACLNFEFMDAKYQTMDQALRSKEALKGRNTYANKLGANSQSELLELHAKIVRYSNRLRNSLKSTSIEMSDLNNKSLIKKLLGDKKIASVAKLHNKIETMELQLGGMLLNSSALEMKSFDLSIAKKERLPFIKKLNKGTITPIEKIALKNIDTKIESIRSEISELENQSKKKVA